MKSSTQSDKVLSGGGLGGEKKALHAEAIEEVVYILQKLAAIHPYQSNKKDDMRI